jgi:hypothetical protein
MQTYPLLTYGIVMLLLPATDRSKSVGDQDLRLLLSTELNSAVFLKQQQLGFITQKKMPYDGL